MHSQVAVPPLSEHVPEPLHEHETLYSPQSTEAEHSNAERTVKPKEMPAATKTPPSMLRTVGDTVTFTATSKLRDSAGTHFATERDRNL